MEILEYDDYLFAGCTCNSCMSLHLEALKSARDRWTNADERIITFKPYHHTCADGCCDDYGIDMYINGYKVNADGQNVESIVGALVAFLNIKNVKVEWQEDEDY